MAEIEVHVIFDDEKLRARAERHHRNSVADGEQNVPSAEQIEAELLESYAAEAAMTLNFRLPCTRETTAKVIRG